MNRMPYDTLFTRRGFAGGAALAALGTFSLPMMGAAGRAYAASEEESDASADGSTADGAAAGPASAVTQKNEVVYPDPVPSDEYLDHIDGLGFEGIDEGFLSALNTFADSFACYCIGQGVGSPEGVGNQCVSPLSAYFALALLAQGARGETQTQLLDALGVSDADELAERCSTLMRVLWASTTPEDDMAPSIMQVANSLWARSDMPLEQGFLDVAAESFLAECYEVSEVGDEAAAAMGSWIAEHTGGNLEPEIELAGNWLMSIINTVWFKDGWLDAFNEADTASDTFHAVNGDVECDFMTRVRRCTVVQAMGYQLASLPLSTGAELLLMLPEEGIDPRSFLGRATGISKMWATTGTSSEYVEATFVVPKVSFERTLGLVDVLRQMGVVDVFGDAADLSGISSASGLVSTVEQGTKFSMNEQGVEASAYTLVAVATGAEIGELDKVELRFDRPFAFRLVDRNGVVLFDGVVDDPTQG